jgi:hypothetical protein
MSDDTLSIDQREAIGQAYVDRLQLLGERIIASVDEVVIGDPNDPVDRASFMASIAAAANDFTDRVHDRGAPDAGGRRMDAFFPRVSLGGDGRWRRPRGPFNPLASPFSRPLLAAVVRVRDGVRKGLCAEDGLLERGEYGLQRLHRRGHIGDPARAIDVERRVAEPQGKRLP